jgi:hypothetical protein
MITVLSGPFPKRFIDFVILKSEVILYDPVPIKIVLPGLAFFTASSIVL